MIQLKTIRIINKCNLFKLQLAEEINGPNHNRICDGNFEPEFIFVEHEVLFMAFASLAG